MLKISNLKIFAALAFTTCFISVCLSQKCTNVKYIQFEYLSYYKNVGETVPFLSFSFYEGDSLICGTTADYKGKAKIYLPESLISDAELNLVIGIPNFFTEDNNTVSHGNGIIYSETFSFKFDSVNKMLPLYLQDSIFVLLTNKKYISYRKSKRISTSNNIYKHKQ